jgi:hypothetical protein
MIAAVETIGAAELVADFRRAAAVLPGECEQVVRLNGVQLVQRIRAHASGRPGPNVITGQYRSSWRFQGAGLTAHVGTDAAQARRLEYGFVGADSLGRVYNQPPFPHVGPAVDEQAPIFEADLLLVVTKVLR